MRYSITNQALIAFLGLVTIFSGTDSYPICSKKYQSVSSLESATQKAADEIYSSLLAHTSLVVFLASSAEVLAVLGNIPEHLRVLPSTTDFLVQEKRGPFYNLHTILL
ncbi:hypothetical protein CGRA01v4_13279 [Colletotrichum graminicola]|nr:hypothetical protein CGRA01v4_13279 [Colletotrichum graminicola]